MRYKSKKRRDAPGFVPDDVDYRLLATFRAALRRFLRVSEELVRHHGVTPQQHQALLAIRGFAGAGAPNVRELAAQLQVAHNAAVGLVDRLAGHGYVRRVPSREDRRRVHLVITPGGRRVLDRLTEAHRVELKRVSPEITRLLEELTAASG